MRAQAQHIPSRTPSLSLSTFSMTPGAISLPVTSLTLICIVIPIQFSRARKRSYEVNLGRYGHNAGL